MPDADGKGNAQARNRGIFAVVAFVLTALGAFLLAFFTRRTESALLAARPLAAIGSIAALGLGWLLATLALISAARSDPGMDPRNASDSAEPDAAPVAPTPDSGSASVGIRRLLVGALLVGALVGVTLGGVGALIAGFHRPGEASFNHAAVQGTGSPASRDEAIREALLVWSRYARPGIHDTGEDAIVESTSGRAFPEDRDAPLTALAWYFGLDAGLFVPAYFCVIGLGLVLCKFTLGRKREAIQATSQTFVAMTRLTYVGVGAVIVAAGSDQLENWLGLTLVAQAWFRGDSSLATMAVPSVSAFILAAASLLKIAAFAVAIATLASSGLYLFRHAGEGEWPSLGGAWRSILAVRVQLTAVVLFVAVMSIRIQVADTFRRWTDDPWVAGAASILVLVLCFVLWASARWMLAQETPPAARLQEGIPPSGLSMSEVVALIALVLVALCLGAISGWEPGWGLAVPLVFIGMILLIGVPLGDVPTRESPPLGPGLRTLPPLIAAFLLAFFGIAIVKASAADLIYEWMRGNGLRELVILACFGIAITLLAPLLYVLLASPKVAGAQAVERGKQILRGSRAGAVWALALSLVAWALVMWLMSQAVHDIAPAIGVAGVLAVFLILLTATVSSLIAVGAAFVHRPPRMLRAMGFTHLPIVTLLVLWAVIAASAPIRSDLHVSVPTEDGLPARTLTLDKAFDRWVERNCLLGDDSRSTNVAFPVRPLVLVSSSGGGVRAAVWTWYVMDQVFGYSDPSSCPTASDPHESNSLFVLSGISGGGLGFAEYVAQMTAAPSISDAEERIQSRLEADSLSPTLAWMLLVEGPWSFLRFGLDVDRASILQQSWERQWDEDELSQNFLDLTTRHPEAPILVLNGASAESGCRFNGSMLDTNGRLRGDPVIGCLEPQGLEGSPDAILPATIDLADFVCEGQEISMGKAALFSARFPIISPVGEIQQCASAGPHEGISADPLPKTFVVDGGYLEGSGTATALDLSIALTPLIAEHNADPRATGCVVPFFLQIDNGYLEPAGPGDVEAPPGFLGLQELSARGRSREGYTTASRQAAQISFGREFRIGDVRAETEGGAELPARYARIHPLAHPGTTAPLGWTLSEASFDDLFAQFAQNQPAVAEVNSWFKDLHCVID